MSRRLPVLTVDDALGLLAIVVLVVFYALVPWPALDLGLSAWLGGLTAP